MVTYTYVLERVSYDYFGGRKCDTKRFETLKEAWAAYVESRRRDGFEDDGTLYKTRKPRLVEMFIKERQPKHGQLLGCRTYPGGLPWWEVEDYFI